MAIRLETKSQEGVHKLFQNLFFFPLLGLLVERITHPANIRAVEEHKCSVPSPNAKSVFSEAVLVPLLHRSCLWAGAWPGLSPERGQSPLPTCSPQFRAFCRRGRVVRLEQNSFMHRVVPEELIGGDFDSLYTLKLTVNLKIAYS